MNFLFANKGPSFLLVRPMLSNVQDHIPAKVYKIDVTQEGVELVVLRDRFTLPEKIYGKDHARYLKMIVDDYKNSQRSVGAMLVGTKGSGKSLLSEAVANKLLEAEIPTLYIDQAYPVRLLKDVIGGIGPCVVIFEEFSKMYKAVADERKTHMPRRDDSPVASDVPTQDALLTLFSDSSLNKVMFLLTDNGTDNISSFLSNRPDRIKYSIEFKSPSFEIFKDLSKDTPIEPSVMDYLEVYFSRHHGSFGLDTMRVLRDAACNTMSVPKMVEKLTLLNVPEPHLKFNTIEAVVDTVNKTMLLVKIESEHWGDSPIKKINLFTADLERVGSYMLDYDEMETVFVTDVNSIKYNEVRKIMFDDRYQVLVTSQYSSAPPWGVLEKSINGEKLHDVWTIKSFSHDLHREGSGSYLVETMVQEHVPKVVPPEGPVGRGMGVPVSPDPFLRPVQHPFPRSTMHER